MRKTADSQMDSGTCNSERSEGIINDPFGVNPEHCNDDGPVADAF